MWQISAPVSEGEAKLLGDALAEQYGAVSAFEGPQGWRLDIVCVDAPDPERLQALTRPLIGRELQIAVERLPAQDWVAKSLEGLGPVVAGLFVVHGSHDRHRVPPGRIALEIEASLAFGTGHHGTTRGCLEALAWIARRGRPSRILDLGTGTGVLAIAAARLWRQPVLASDIDPVSVRHARDNARRNGASALVEVIEAAGLRGARFRERGPFGLVLANILAGPLVGLAQPMRSHLAPGAYVVLSGLLPAQETRVLAAYRAAGLRLEKRSRLEGWSTLVLRDPRRGI